MIIFNGLYQLSVYSVFIPFISGLLLVKFLDNNSKIILILLAFASASQVSSVFLFKNIINSFYNLYTVIDISFWAYLFLYNTKTTYSKTIGIMLYAVQLLVIASFFYWEGIKSRFFFELVCLDNLVQVIWVLILFYEKYKRDEITRLEKQPIFWFCIGILIYAPCTYFLFAFYNKTHHKESYVGLWNLHSTLNTLLYLAFTIGMWINRKTEEF